MLKAAGNFPAAFLFTSILTPKTYVSFLFPD